MTAYQMILNIFNSDLANEKSSKCIGSNSEG